MQSNLANKKSDNTSNNNKDSNNINSNNNNNNNRNDNINLNMGNNNSNINNFGKISFPTFDYDLQKQIIDDEFNGRKRSK